MIYFYLEGSPTIEDAGFNNSKSSWKIEYQLYLADWAELKKIGRCGKLEDAEKEYCSHTINKKFDKRIKNFAIFVSKNKYSRNQLSLDSNRKIVETVNFTPQIVDIFNQAAEIYEKNPVFVFFVKARVSTKNSAKAKLKKKYMTEGLHFLKIYKPDKTFDYWNLSKLSFGLEVVKTEDGSLRLQAGFTHFGLNLP